MTTKTEKQEAALDFVRREGRAFAGRNHGRDGSVRTISASVWRALERKGLVQVSEMVGGGLVVVSVKALEEA